LRRGRHREDPLHLPARLAQQVGRLRPQRGRKRPDHRDDRDHARRAGAQAVSSRPGGLQTEFEFVLPKGYVDREGNLHRRGTMRLATANDEIAPLRDLRVRENQAYLTVVILSRLITRLATLPAVNSGLVENV